MLPNGCVLGVVPGTTFELVGESLPKLLSALKRALRRKYAEHPWMDSPLTEPQLREVKIAIQPTVEVGGRIHTSSQPVKLPVHAVVGRNDYGSHSGYILRFDVGFDFYEASEVPILVENIVRGQLRGQGPERLHRYLSLDEPWLERIEVRVKGNPRENVQQPIAERAPKLVAIAEQLPHGRSIRRLSRAFPSVAWEREAQVAEVVAKLSDERANLLVVGDPGVGKSAILLEAIRKIARRKPGTDEPSLQTFWKTAAYRLTTGARYFGEWQKIADSLAEELGDVKGVLWLADFVNLLCVGEANPESSLGAYWSPHLDRGRFQIVGEVTPRELEAARTLLPGLIERFQVVHVEEMGTSALLRVLSRLGEYAGQNLGIEIEREALEATYRLQSRFSPYGRFPGKAVSFLSDVLGEMQLSGRKRVGARDVAELFVERTGLPSTLVQDEVLLDPDELSGFFHERIKGQADAIDKVCNVVKVFKAGLCDLGKPIATMLFAGPTGVGKSETARALGDYFFGAGQRLDPLIRLDMSELQHPVQIDRLIGTAQEPGKLVEQVRERPFSVLLLDEVEKAHPVFFDILLTVLDEGLLFDAMGRETCFKSCIVVMTSNLGSGSHCSLGFGKAKPPDYESEVRAHFRPEFCNRIDYLVTFHPLGRETAAAIVRKELGGLEKREGIEDRGLRLRFTDELFDWIGEAGFDPRYGARPLQRAIERLVVGPLSRRLLDDVELRNCVLELGWQQEDQLSIVVGSTG